MSSIKKSNHLICKNSQNTYKMSQDLFLNPEQCGDVNSPHLSFFSQTGHSYFLRVGVLFPLAELGLQLMFIENLKEHDNYIKINKHLLNKELKYIFLSFCSILCELSSLNVSQFFMLCIVKQKEYSQKVWQHIYQEQSVDQI